MSTNNAWRLWSAWSQRQELRQSVHLLISHSEVLREEPISSNLVKLSADPREKPTVVGFRCYTRYYGRSCVTGKVMAYCRLQTGCSRLYHPIINRRACNTTWVYSNDCQREAAISGDLPKAARVLSSSALRTGGMLHCRSPRITTTGVHWGCSQSASRAFSLWGLNAKKNKRDFPCSKATENDQQ